MGGGGEGGLNAEDETELEDEDDEDEDDNEESDSRWIHLSDLSLLHPNSKLHFFYSCPKFHFENPIFPFLCSPNTFPIRTHWSKVYYAVVTDSKNIKAWISKKVTSP